MYSFSGNCAASVPISKFMCLWELYIFPGSVYIFPPAELADRSWEYINHPQTHECRNWDWDPRYSFSGNICFEISLFCLCSVREASSLCRGRRCGFFHNTDITLLQLNQQDVGHSRSSSLWLRTSTILPWSSWAPTTESFTYKAYTDTQHPLSDSWYIRQSATYNIEVSNVSDDRQSTIGRSQP